MTTEPGEPSAFPISCIVDGQVMQDSNTSELCFGPIELVQYISTIITLAPGDLIVYPGGLSECEILLAYGAVDFSSKVGQLAGNHFASIVDGRQHLAEVGRRCLWEGAQPLRIEEIDDEGGT